MDDKDYPILYVDDEHANRVVIKHNLGQQFTLRIADSAEAALEILHREPVAVLLADQRMPRVTGVDLAEQVLQRYPDVVRVIITAYSDLEATIDAINRARVNRFIKKPWTREELVAVMRESVHSYRNSQLINQMRERLRQLDRMTTLAVMASAIGHDLRQPLAYIEPTLDAIAQELDRLESMPLDARGRARVDGAQDALQDLREGISRFKVMADALVASLRDQDGSTETKMLDLKSVVEGAASLTYGTVIRRALWQLELPNEPVMMEASEGRLLQLLFNLVLNAVQAIAPGKAWGNSVGVSVTATEDHVKIMVRDTGCGIAPEHMDKIFVPLFTTKGGEGSGLGLAICKQIVDEMRGSVDVETWPGKGSLFTVTLPRRAGAGAEG